MAPHRLERDGAQKSDPDGQNFVPFLAEAKNTYYHLTRKYLGRVHDREFASIRLLPQGPDDLFIDVGANRGQSILAIRHYRPGARIVSFEPNPVIFQRLQRLFGTVEGVRLINRGLGPAHAIQPLFIPSYRGFVYDGIATFSREAVMAYFGPQTLYFYDPARLAIAETDCFLDTLDSFDLAPSFMKIDVEGYEYDVLLGARQTLLRYEPVLMLERYFGDARVRPMLETLGYTEVVARWTSSATGRFEPGESDGLNMVLMTQRRLHGLG